MDNKEGPFKPVPEGNNAQENPAATPPTAENKPMQEATAQPPKAKEKTGFFGRLFGFGQEEQPAPPTPETKQPEAHAEDKANTTENPLPEDHTSSWVPEKKDKSPEIPADNASETSTSKEGEIQNEEIAQKAEPQGDKEPELDTQDAIIPASEKEETDTKTDVEEHQEQPSPVEDLKVADEDKKEEINEGNETIADPEEKQQDIETQDAVIPTDDTGKSDGEMKEEKTEDQDKDAETNMSDIPMKEENDGQEPQIDTPTNEETATADDDTIREAGEKAYKATISNEKGEIDYAEAQNQITTLTEQIEAITDEGAKKNAESIKDDTLISVLFNVLKTNNDPEKNAKIAELHEKMTDKAKADAIVGYSALKAIGTDKAQEFVDMITDAELKEKIQTEIKAGDSIPLRVLRKELWDQVSTLGEESKKTIISSDESPEPASTDKEIPAAA